MQAGEIHLASLPFGDVPGMKLRPVLLLTGLVGPVPEVLVAYISSVFPSALLSSDLVLDPSRPDHASTNLKSTSVLRLHKLATIHATSIARRLGCLSPAVSPEIARRLRSLLNV